MLTSIAWSHVVCDNISLLTFILTLNILILISPIKYGIYSTGILKQKSLVHHVSSNLYYFLAKTEVSTKFYCKNALNHHCMNFIIYRNNITKLMKKKICKRNEWNLKNVTYLKWDSTLQHYVKLYHNVWKSCNIAH